MLNIHHHESQPSRVTVAFEHSAVSFMMSKDATFEDLTDRLDRLGNRRHGKPVAIAVKLAYPSAPSDADTFAAFLITGSMFLQPAHAQSVPQGSYRTSCTDIRVEDRTLTAVCGIAVLPGTEDIPHRCQSLRRRYRERQWRAYMPSRQPMAPNRQDRR